jgi:WhiB family redox-sensing transcriptional regulator
MTATVGNLTALWSRAACRTADPELFFPVSASGPALGQAQRAKAVCAGCPVCGECLRYALAAGPLQGVWGGMTEEERRLLRQREAKARQRMFRAGHSGQLGRVPGSKEG